MRRDRETMAALDYLTRNGHHKRARQFRQSLDLPARTRGGRPDSEPERPYSGLGIGYEPFSCRRVGMCRQTRPDSLGSVARSLGKPGCMRLSMSLLPWGQITLGPDYLGADHFRADWTS